MTHIELVTGKKIRVKETLYEIAEVSGPIFRLTMVSSKRVWNSAKQSWTNNPKEQEIFLREDKIVYVYEEGDSSS
tara:strand:+ start:18 stop:242 length:225 start_codon:yes stop_codon:yes gene_type:complete